MKKLLLATSLLALCGCSGGASGDQAASRQAQATATMTNAADREVGMPRIRNFAQRKLLKNAYEDMDQTTLVYVYTQALDGKFVCLGQAVGYGVSLGTQFTPPEYPRYIRGDSGADTPNTGTYMLALPEPNGLYQPDSGAATIVNLIGADGAAHTALVEPNVVTTPSKLPPSAVNVPCPADIDPERVTDAKETSAVAQRD